MEEEQALDGGWGWLVALSSFMVAFVVDGVVNSFGITMPELQQSYQTSVTVISLAPGLLVGCFLLTSPLTAVLARKFGCRRVAFTGGIVTSISVVLATRAEAVEMFIVCYGVFAGIGIGLIYLPSITMINTYFHKKRGMVVGVVTSGSGVGLLVMAIVIDRLMAEFGWRGCYLIIAGIYLNLCVCACLMRPIEDNKRYKARDALEVEGREASTVLVNGKENGSSFSTSPHNHIGSDREVLDCLLKDVIERHDLCEPPKVQVIETSGVPYFQSEMQNKTLFKGDMKTTSATSLPQSKVNHAIFTPKENLANGFRQDDHEQEKPTNQNNADNDISDSQSQSYKFQNEAVTSTSTTTPFGSGQNFKGSGLLLNPHHHHLYHPHPHHHHNHIQSPSHHSSRYTMSEKSDVESNPPHEISSNRKTFLNQPIECASTLSINSLMSPSRSMHSVRSRSQHSLKSRSLHSFKSRSLSTLQDGSKTSLNEDLDENLNFAPHSAWGLFRIIRFDLFCAGAFMIQISQSIPAMFTPSYAISLGLDQSSAANIVSILGISNTVGRFAAGVLANLRLGSVRVYNFGTFLAGAACYLLPFCTTYEYLVAFAVGHGFFIGFFPPLQSVILVEQLGLELLPSSFGIMCLCKSVASMVGPSLAGALFELVGNYSVPFYFAGGILTLSNILHCVMSFCPKHTR